MQLDSSPEKCAVSRLFGGVSYRAATPSEKMALVLLDYLIFEEDTSKEAADKKKSEKDKKDGDTSISTHYVKRREWTGPINRARALLAVAGMESDIAEKLSDALAEPYNNWRTGVRERTLVYSSYNVGAAIQKAVAEQLTAMNGLSDNVPAAAKVIGQLLTYGAMEARRVKRQYSYDRYRVEDRYELLPQHLPGLYLDACVPATVAAIVKAASHITGVTVKTPILDRISSYVEDSLKAIVEHIRPAQKNAERVCSAVVRYATVHQHDLLNPRWTEWWDNGLRKYTNVVVKSMTTAYSLFKNLAALTDSRAIAEVDAVMGLGDLRCMTAAFINRRGVVGSYDIERRASPYVAEGAKMISSTVVRYNWRDDEGIITLLSTGIHLGGTTGSKDKGPQLWSVIEDSSDDAVLDKLEQDLRDFAKLTQLTRNHVDSLLGQMYQNAVLESYITDPSERFLAASVAKYTYIDINELPNKGWTETDAEKLGNIVVDFKWKFKYHVQKGVLPRKLTIPSDETFHVTLLPSDVLCTGVITGQKTMSIAGVSDLMASATPLEGGMRRLIIDQDPKKLTVAYDVNKTHTLAYQWPEYKREAGTARLITGKTVDHSMAESYRRIIGLEEGTDQVVWFAGLARRRFDENAALADTKRTLISALAASLLAASGAPADTDSDDVKTAMERIIDKDGGAEVQKKVAASVDRKMKDMVTDWFAGYCLNPGRISLVTDSMMRAGIEWRQPLDEPTMRAHITNMRKFMTTFSMPALSLPDSFVMWVDGILSTDDAMLELISDIFGGAADTLIDMGTGEV